MKLCLRAGGAAILDPDAFRESMPDEVFEEWASLYAIDPWDGERDDLLMGILASTLANVNRDSKKRPDPFTAAEFSPDWFGVDADGERHLKTQEELADATDATLAALAAIRALNGNHDRQPGAQDHSGRG